MRLHAQVLCLLAFWFSRGDGWYAAAGIYDGSSPNLVGATLAKLRGNVNPISTEVILLRPFQSLFGGHRTLPLVLLVYGVRSKK